MQTNYNEYYGIKPLIEENLTEDDVQRRTLENLNDPRVESFTVTKRSHTPDEKEAERLASMNRHQRRAEAAQARLAPKPKRRR